MERKKGGERRDKREGKEKKRVREERGDKREKRRERKKENLGKDTRPINRFCTSRSKSNRFHI